MTVHDIESLRKHLQWAIQIEHTTIPPYLCALYTIKDGHNQEAAEILRSIFMEEMLHMTLAANILNAIGGSPQFDKPDFIATYPAYLPHSDRSFQVPLGKFSRPVIDTMMKFEKPEAEGAPPEDDNYETFGQFYDAIENGLIQLSKELGQERLFCGDPGRQITEDSFSYGGSGRIIAITDLDSALEALEEIIEQGEGLDHGSIWDGDRNMFHHEREEVGHYFRLNQIVNGRYYTQGDTPQSGPTGKPFEVDWEAIYNMQPNPRSSDYPVGSDVEVAMLRFNTAYSEMLGTMQQAFNGNPAKLTASIGAMMELKNLAVDLMKLPSGEGQTCAGPSFEYVAPQHRTARNTSQVKISVSKDGPYRIQGGLALYRKEVVYSELDEPLTWRKINEIQTSQNYALCRCGESNNKPFCDGSHTRISFDGTETADTQPTVERQKVIEGENIEGTNIRVKSDLSLCTHARFCFNRFGNLNQMMPSASDVRIRNQVIAMVERCPSGALTYEINVDNDTSNGYQKVEPDLPTAISVITDGPLWVTGGILIERADGQPIEIRNRVTLCRCGHSKNKPFCDGTHSKIDFTG
jgi:CDGSH-type Zn-finger protein